MIRQELNPETCRLDGKLAGTSERRPFLISQIKASVFVSARLAMIPGTPCIEFRIRKGEDKGRKRERSFTSIWMLHTHTRVGEERKHPAHKSCRFRSTSKLFDVWKQAFSPLSNNPTACHLLSLHVTWQREWSKMVGVSPSGWEGNFPQRCLQGWAFLRLKAHGPTRTPPNRQTIRALISLPNSGHSQETTNLDLVFG